MGPSATGWSNWVGRIHIMCSGPFRDHYGTPGAPKRARFGPERPFWEPWRSLGSPGKPDLDLTAMGWSNWIGLMVTTHFDLVSVVFVGAKGPKRPFFGPTFPFWGLQRCRTTQIGSQKAQ